MTTYRLASHPAAQLLRAGLFALAMTWVGAPPLLGQAVAPDSGPLPTALAQASPFGPGSITFNITAPPTISIETPAPGAETDRSATRAASATAGAPAQPESHGASEATAVQEAAHSPAGAGAVGSTMVGYASWYGTKFQGRLTANGEIYDMYRLTAANRTLPFGTLVRVTNLDNGASVVVRINDRGPFVDGRIIDLSKAAAEIIGMPGIAEVRLQIVGTATAVEFAPMEREELAAAHLSAPEEAAPVASQGSKLAAATPSAPGGTALPDEHHPPVALSLAGSVVHLGPGKLGAAVTPGSETEVRQPLKQDSATPGALAGRPTQGAVQASMSATTPRFPSRLTLQVGAFRDSDNAARLERLLAANGFAPRAEQAGELTRVLIPQVPTSELTLTKKRLASLGITTVLVRTE